MSATLTQGYQHLDAGDFPLAEHWFRLATTTEPTCADGFAALGNVLALAGRWNEAALALEQADALDPDQPFRLAALAQALTEAGRWTAVASVGQRWLARVPDSTPARSVLGRALAHLGHDREAVPLLRETVLLDPGDDQAAVLLCRSLTCLGDPLAALEQIQPTLRRCPNQADLHAAIGSAWAALGESGKAQTAWRYALTLDPTDAAGIADLLAYSESAHDTPPPAPVYVRALFDRYADRFDQDLVNRLDYRVPELLLKALGKMSPTTFDVLDLGCGTGLAGVAFAPFARYLAGVDLSPRMIVHAQRRGVYNVLETGDLLDTLRRQSQRWSLILAADVFTYLGDLGPVLLAAAKALLPQGRLAATVEASHDSTDDYLVSPTRRVKHSRNHIQAAANAAGLRLIHLENATLRRERNEPVEGMVFVLEKEGKD